MQKTLYIDKNVATLKINGVKIGNYYFDEWKQFTDLTNETRVYFYVRGFASCFVIVDSIEEV